MTDIPPISSIGHLFCDFDGVFTDNRVYTDQYGNESVCCNRSDGYAIRLLNAYVALHGYPLLISVLTMEANPVVMQRCKKMQVNCEAECLTKGSFISRTSRRLKSRQSSASKIVYVGNDLNDLECFDVADFTVCPADSHSALLSRADLVLSKPGGCGAVRELVELMLYNEGLTAEGLHGLISYSRDRN